MSAPELYKGISSRLCIITLLITVVSGHAQSTELQWCVDNLPGIHEFKGSKLTGTIARFIDSVSQRAKVEIKHTEDTPFNRCLRSMKQGDTDIMVSLNKSAEREQYMHFIPIYRGLAESLFFSKQHGQNITHESQLKELRIGQITGFAYNTIDVPVLAQSNQMIAVDSLDDGLVMLYLNHLDLLIAPKRFTSAFAKLNPRYHDVLDVSDFKLRNGQNKMVHLAISKNSQVPEETISRLERAIVALRQENKIVPLIFPQEDQKARSMIAVN